MTDNKPTTATIDRATLRRIHRARLYRRETINEVLNRALAALEKEQGPKSEAVRGASAPLLHTGVPA